VGAVSLFFSCVAMAERHSTVVCAFDLASPRITVHDIHEWIFAVLQIPEHSVQMIQVDADTVHGLLRDTAGQAEYK
jgi:hypothetical protein